jgi:hypothetical protein
LTMNNLHLEILQLQGARFVEIVPGTKRPQGAGWQLNPRTLDQVATPAVGMLLGDASAGIMAVDFDGASAIEYWAEHVMDTVPDTVMWTSGKTGRFQAAYRVPEEIRPLVPTKFARNTGEGEQLEWRYGRDRAGFQSVLPPSIHPDRGTPYTWLEGMSPADREIAECPVELLEWAFRETAQRDVVAEIRSPMNTHSDSIAEATALRRIAEIIAGMRPGNRSHPACQVGALMRHVRTDMHGEIILRLMSAGCDRAAIASAKKYSQMM